MWAVFRAPQEARGQDQDEGKPVQLRVPSGGCVRGRVDVGPPFLPLFSGLLGFARLYIDFLVTALRVSFARLYIDFLFTTLRVSFVRFVH